MFNLLKLSFIFVSLFISLLGLLSVTSDRARADLEIKGNYGYVTVNPNDLTTIDQANLNSTFPKVAPIAGFGGTLMYYLPGGFGLGGTYDQLSSSVSNLGLSQTVMATRGAVLAGYRFVDLIAYLGLIGSYGLTHTMKATTSGYADLVPSTISSYSGGIEFGVHVGFLILGVEGGYLSFVGKDIQTNGGSVTVNGNKSNMDLSGPYAKGVIGLSL